MDEAAKQKLRAAIDKGLGDWLKEGQCHEPTCGCETVWVEDEMFPIIDSLLTEAQAAALAMAADAASQDAQVIVTSLGNIETVMAESAPESFCGKVSQDFERTMKAAMRVNKRILALSPLDVARYIERLRLEARKQGIQYAITHYQKGASYLQCELVELKRQIAANACTCDRDSWPGKANTNLHEIGCPARNAEVKK